MLWAHNDSGDGPLLYALTRRAAIRATVRLAGAASVDWEDVAAGPGPVRGRPYLYVADIGDNLRARPEVVVYRVREPRLPADDGRALTLGGVTALRLRYPDGPRDAEALLVDPRRRQLVIVEKTADGGPAGIYVAPLAIRPGAPTTLTRAGTLPLPTGRFDVVTAADASADGSQLAVRTYASVLLWTRRPGRSVAATLATRPCRGPLPLELQGEAIALAPDGRSYTTVPEGTGAAISTFIARG